MPTILLIEDNAADVELFRMALEEAHVDCSLVVFEDGGEAIQHIRNAADTPDLIVLDLNVPRNDGIEILQVIRAAPLFANVSIAVLSSSSSPREKAKLAAFHIREFIVKPADLEEYLKIGGIVGNLLRESASQPARS